MKYRIFSFLLLSFISCDLSTKDETVVIEDYIFYMEDVDKDGHSPGGGDCDDKDATVYPGAPEIVDGLDNDCDGIIDEGTEVYDDDGDGFSEDYGDCDDGDSSAYPGAEEVEDDRDNDCDGDIDEEGEFYDYDGDGYTEVDGDCDDRDRLTYPGAYEECGNGIDDDCSGGDETCEGWNFETVESDVDIEGISISVDTDNLVHIAYSVEVDPIRYYDVLKYAYFDGTSWSIETIDSGEIFIHNISIDTDSNSRPHIAYWAYLFPSILLKYARYDGREWVIETVSYNCDDLSLAIDSNNNPHISFDGNELVYAHYDSEWTIEVVDTYGNVGLYNDIAVDSSDNPHISYFDYDHGNIKYAHFDGSSWDVQTIDSGITYTIAVDSYDRPHLAYGPYFTDPQIVVAYYDGSTWISESIPVRYGTIPSLYLDSMDNPHIFGSESEPYSDIINFRYLYHDDSTWNSQTFISGDFFSYIDFTVDTDGLPHAAFENIRDNALVHVWYSGNK